MRRRAGITRAQTKNNTERFMKTSRDCVWMDDWIVGLLDDENESRQNMAPFRQIRLLAALGSPDKHS